MKLISRIYLLFLSILSLVTSLYGQDNDSLQLIPDSVLREYLIFDSTYQKKIFEDFDFNKGGYAFVFIYVNQPRYKWFRDSLGRLFEIDTTKHYYTEDTAVMNIIKQDWILNRGDMYECWYDYFGYLTYNDSTILSMRINLDCNELQIKYGSFKLHPELLTKHYPDFKRLRKRTFILEDIEDGRKFWKDSVEGNNQYVLKDEKKPDWVDFDGEFYFYCPNSHQTNTDYLKQIIQEKYPGQHFALKSKWDYKDDKYKYLVKCKKGFYDQFDLFPKEQWKRYSFKNEKIEMFWKDRE